MERIVGFMSSNALTGFASSEEAADAVAAYLPHRPRPKDLSGLAKNLRLGEDGRYRWHWDPRFLFDEKGERRPRRDPERLRRAAHGRRDALEGWEATARRVAAVLVAAGAES